MERGPLGSSGERGQLLYCEAEWVAEGKHNTLLLPPATNRPQKGYHELFVSSGHHRPPVVVAAREGERATHYKFHESLLTLRNEGVS